MDFPCESEINVRNDNALRFAVVSQPAPVIEYLKTIASLIGATHILGVFEDKEFIKVYFDDKKYVDTLIRSGIHVMGHHVKVDYVVPPGSKITLSNIDPVISNNDLLSLLSMFGTVVSPVFRSPISDDVELCHIDHGVRYVYMDLNNPIPESLEFKYGDQLCRVNIKVDDSVLMIDYVKKEPGESSTTFSTANASDSSTDPSNDDDVVITDPVVVSVQTAIEELNSTQQIDTLQPNGEVNNLLTNKRSLYRARRAKLIKTSQIKKIKHNVKYRSRKTKRYRLTRRKTVVKKETSIKESPKKQLSSSVCSSNLEDSSLSLSDINNSSIKENFEAILDEDKLKLFLDEVRCQRAPIELVKKYLGSDFDSNALLCLLKQLSDLKKQTNDVAFKVRMRRLISNLKGFLNV